MSRTALALTLKSEDAFAPLLNAVVLPVLLLSGILLPMTIGPKWLLNVSDWMPFRWVVDAVRTAFAGDFATSPMVWGSVWAAVLFVAAVAWGTATFRKENA